VNSGAPDHAKQIYKLKSARFMKRFNVDSFWEHVGTNWYQYSHFWHSPIFLSDNLLWTNSTL